MGKRGNNEGSVYQRKSDGKWCAAATLPDGRRRTVYGKTQKEALTRLRALQDQIEHGLELRPGREMTLGQYLTSWTAETLPSRVTAGRLAPSTLASYRDQVRLHLIPDLGHLRLTQVTPPRLRTWLARKQTEIGHRGKPLSPRSVAYLHAVLRAALNDAVRDELLVRNSCLLVAPPRVGRNSGKALDAEALGRVLKAVEGHRLKPLWIVLLALGLRKGEALALHWEDVDFDGEAIRVHRNLQRLRDAEPDPATGRRKGRLVERQTTKTGEDAVLAMPAVVTRALEEHRKRQIKERLSARVWVNPDLVFTTSAGTPVEPRNLSRSWTAICAAARIEPVRIHDLRHTAATLLLAQGVDLKVVQKVLRHSRLSTTADIYAHVTKQLERAAADKMDEAFGLFPQSS